MNIDIIGDTILDESSSPGQLRDALDAFSLMSSDASNIQPDPSFSAWAGDSLLANGVAISPEAAAHCVADYQRCVMFIRGIYAAINTLRERFPDTPLEILYAGCGPFATLVLPLLGKFSPGELKLYLLDVHQRSLDSVECLLAAFGFGAHAVQTIEADACSYQHPGKLHLVIAETMQKSLEQEPQFAVTANLATQLVPTGIFIPQRIEVSLYLADLGYEEQLADQSSGIADRDRNTQESSAGRYLLANLCTLVPESASGQMQLALAQAEGAGPELEPTIVVIPAVPDISQLDAALFTHICVFEQYQLKNFDSQITLPMKCHELLPLTSGECYRVSYQLGSYPKFNFERLTSQ
jgi:hypothetical protein